MGPPATRGLCPSPFATLVACGGGEAVPDGRVLTDGLEKH
jgi:hypothetical protein